MLPPPFTLFAQARGNPWARPEVLFGALAIFAALLLGGAVIFAIDRWRKREPGPTRESEVVELSGFRGMLDRGEITEDEYNRLLSKVAGKAKAKAAPTSPVGGEPTPPPAAAPFLPGPLPDDYFDDPPPPVPPTPPG